LYDGEFVAGTGHSICPKFATIFQSIVAFRATGLILVQLKCSVKDARAFEETWLGCRRVTIGRELDI